MIGEYDWTSDGAADFVTAAEATNVVGTMFWSLFLHADGHGFVEHDDGFTFHYPGDDPPMRVGGRRAEARVRDARRRAAAAAARRRSRRG